MADQQSKNQEPKNQEPRKWEQQLRDAAAHMEEDVRQVVEYFNDDVVPDLRRNGSQALRAAAAKLHELAQRMDDRKAAASAASEKTPPRG